MFIMEQKIVYDCAIFQKLYVLQNENTILVDYFIEIGEEISDLQLK